SPDSAPTIGADARIKPATEESNGQRRTTRQQGSQETEGGQAERRRLGLQAIAGQGRTIPDPAQESLTGALRRSPIGGAPAPSSRPPGRARGEATRRSRTAATALHLWIT